MPPGLLSVKETPRSQSSFTPKRHGNLDKEQSFLLRHVLHCEILTVQIQWQQQYKYLLWVSFYKMLCSNSAAYYNQV